MKIMPVAAAIVAVWAASTVSASAQEYGSFNNGNSQAIDAMQSSSLLNRRFGKQSKRSSISEAAARQARIRAGQARRAREDAAFAREYARRRAIRRQGGW